MIELSRFNSSKETDNKLRWEAPVGETSFQLYIPKWRVPEPWPGRIAVRIDPRRSATDDLPNLTRDVASKDPTARLEPIVVTVHAVSEHTKTRRYDPVGDVNSWEIGSPYIPHELTHGGIERLRVLVLWEIGTRGRFGDWDWQPTKTSRPGPNAEE